MDSDGGAMKKLVVSALAYYGLKVSHVFDGRQFRACLKLIEIDRLKALEEFRQIVDANGDDIVERFAREFCRTTEQVCDDSTAVIPGSQIQPQTQSVVPVPEPILKLLPQKITEQGNWFTRNFLPPIWSVLSTFNKDNSGHYVAPYNEEQPGKTQADAETKGWRLNYGSAMFPTENFPIEDEETCLRNLEEYVCPPAIVNVGPSEAYSPTRDFSPNRNLAEGRQILGQKPSAVPRIETVEQFYQWIQYLGVPNNRNDGVPSQDATQPPCIPKVEEIVPTREDTPKVCSVEVAAPVSWRLELAKTRPDLYNELLEDLNTNTDHEGPNEDMVDCGIAQLTEPLDALPTLIDVEMEDVENIEEESHFPTAYGAVYDPGLWFNKVERKRKRIRGTDDKVSGRTIMNDSSSSGSIGRGKVRMKPRILWDVVNPEQVPKTIAPFAVNGKSNHSEAEIPVCAKGSEEAKVLSEACSWDPNSNGADQNADEYESEPPQKRNKISWPTPLYGSHGVHRTANQTLPKSFLANLVTEDDSENCEHEVRGNFIEKCSKCNQKEEISFSKYTRLFKDDPAWKQKFLDGEKLGGERLTCDICSSKRNNQTFKNVKLLLSHARKGTELRRPEHQGYAKAIENLMQLNQPGYLESCHSSVGTKPPFKEKRVWPPVFVLENTFKASDQCSDIRNLETEVTNRLRGFVNIEAHTLHRVRDEKGYFKGQILVEFPPTQRGLVDARRLHQHFLFTGRSLRDWQVVEPRYEGLLNYQPGGEEHYGLAKIGPRGEILSRVYFGYLATSEIMERIDPYRRFVPWQIEVPGEASFDGVEDED